MIEAMLSTQRATNLRTINGLTTMGADDGPSLSFGKLTPYSGMTVLLVRLYSRMFQNSMVLVGRHQTADPQ
jgi:hypothetical protein